MSKELTFNGVPLLFNPTLGVDRERDVKTRYIVTREATETPLFKRLFGEVVLETK